MQPKGVFFSIHGPALAFYASLSLYGLHATVTHESHDGVMRHTGFIGNQAPGSTVAFLNADLLFLLFCVGSTSSNGEQGRVPAYCFPATSQQPSDSRRLAAESITESRRLKRDECPSCDGLVIPTPAKPLWRPLRSLTARRASEDKQHVSCTSAIVPPTAPWNADLSMHLTNKLRRDRGRKIRAQRPRVLRLLFVR